MKDIIIKWTIKSYMLLYIYIYIYIYETPFLKTWTPALKPPIRTWTYRVTIMPRVCDIHFGVHKKWNKMIIKKWKEMRWNRI